MLEVANSCKKEGILGRRTYLVFRTMLSGLKINSSLALHLLLGGKKKPAVKIQLCKSLKCGLFFFPPTNLYSVVTQFTVVESVDTGG